MIVRVEAAKRALPWYKAGESENLHDELPQTLTVYVLDSGGFYRQAEAFRSGSSDLHFGNVTVPAPGVAT